MRSIETQMDNRINAKLYVDVWNIENKTSCEVI